ncbi:hypothetical protein VME_45720 [Vibrio harveyi 1DA3]|nr:hypothetical protein VME_45720 [Vibrio harveyi 1DA3]
MTDFIKNTSTFYTGNKNINTNLLNPRVYEEEKDKLVIPLVYGDAFVEPIKIYENTAKDILKNNSDVRTEIFALSIGDIQGIKAIHVRDINGKEWNILDDSAIITDGVAKSTDYAFKDVSNKNYAQLWARWLFSVEVRSGKKNQSVLSYANKLYGNDPEKPWNTTKKANGIALVSFSQAPIYGKYFTDTKEIKIKVGGRRVVDFDHPKGSRPRVSSNNAALALFDYLTNKDFGAGYDESLIDIPSFQSVRNYLGVIRHKFGGTLDLRKSIKDNVKAIVDSFQGIVYEHDGKIHLRANKAETISESFDESNIIGKLRVDHAESAKRVNTVTLKFSATNKSGAAYMALPDSPDAQLAKDGKVISKEFKTNFVSDIVTAKKLVNFLYRYHTKNRRVAFLDVASKSYSLKPYDVIEISDNENRLDKVKFRVDSITTGLGKNLGKTSITATEYFTSDYTGDVNVTAPTEPDVKPNENITLPPRNLRFTLTNPNVNTNIGSLVWDKSQSATVNEYEIQYKKSTSATWIEHSTTSMTSASMAFLESVNYDFRVRALDSLSYASNWIELKKVDLTDGFIYPKPTGQALETANPDKTISETPDWIVTWDDVRDNLLPNQSDERFKDRTFNDFFKYYEIKVKSGSTVLHTAQVKTNRFVYTLEQAKADEIRRRLDFEISFVSLSGKKSEPSGLTANNPQQRPPKNISVKGGVSGLFVEFNYPTEKDFVGVKVHVGDESEFNPDSNTLVGDIQGTNQFTKAYSQIEQGTYYVKLGAYDALGTDNIQYSSSYRFTIEDIDIHIDSISVSDLANDLKAKVEQIDTNALDIAGNTNGVNAIDSKLDTETTNRISGDKALGSRIDTVLAKSNLNASAIQTEKTTRASADAALGKRIDTVTATANTDRGKYNALVTRVTTAETNIAGKASAASVTTLQTTVNGQTASIKDNARSINGVKAQRVIKTDANGVIAGIGLLSDSNAPSGAQSEVSIIADNFYVLGSSSDSKATSKIPFYVTGGKTFIKEAMIKDASIQSAKIGSMDVGKMTTGTLRTATDILAGSGNNTSGMSGKAGIRFWAGKADRNSAPFRVNSAGRVDCTNLHVSGSSTFKGDITGASGTFEGTIRANKIIGDFLRVYQSNAISSVIYTSGSNTPPRLNSAVIPVSKNKNDLNNITITTNFANISSDPDIDRRYVALTDIGAMLYIPNGYNSAYQVSAYVRVQIYNNSTKKWQTVQNYEYNSSQVWLMNAVGNKAAYFHNDSYNNILLKPYLTSGIRIPKGKSHRLRLVGRARAMSFNHTTNKTTYLAGVKLLFTNQPDSTCQFGLTKFN